MSFNLVHVHFVHRHMDKYYFLGLQSLRRLNILFYFFYLPPPAQSIHFWNHEVMYNSAPGTVDKSYWH